MGEAKLRKLAGIYPEQIKKQEKRIQRSYSVEQVAGALVMGMLGGALNSGFTYSANDPELKPDKGLKNGSCNRRDCQQIL